MTSPVRSPVLALAALCLAVAPPTSAQQTTEGVPPGRPRVALAPSGGGARGIAHLGALRALEEGGIPVDAVAANSKGAIVGGIYATGKTAAELEAIVRSMDWASLFSGRPDRRMLPVWRRTDRYASTAGVSFDWKGLRLPGGLLAWSPSQPVTDWMASIKCWWILTWPTTHTAPTTSCIPAR